MFNFSTWKKCFFNQCKKEEEKIQTPDYYFSFYGECSGSNEIIGISENDNNGDWKTLKDNCAVACKNKKHNDKKAKGFN